jgi:hypothetical protein
MTSPELTPRKAELSTKSLYDQTHDPLGSCPLPDCRCRGGRIERSDYLKSLDKAGEGEDAAFREAMAPSEPETLHERVERIIDSEGA